MASSPVILAMKRPLKVLLVEDSEDDAELLCRELRRGGYELTARRIDTAEDMHEAIEKPRNMASIGLRRVPAQGSAR